jgi:pimeloyl-ACP methyl ester carboxylesterase
VAFHGWGGDHREFAPLAARLPDDALLLSADLPGYGRTPKPARWDLEEMMDSMDREISALHPTDLTLVGFCSGAIVALLLAQRIPDRVRRIVMIDPFAYLPWYFRIFVAGEFGRRAYRFTFAHPFGRALTTRILRRRQATDDDFMGAFSRVDHETTQEWLRLLHNVGGVDRFAGLRLPIDIAFGERTFAAVRKSVGRYQALWPQAVPHPLRNVGHLPIVRGAKQLAPIVFGEPGARPRGVREFQTEDPQP